jgi:hypothetical protein
MGLQDGNIMFELKHHKERLDMLVKSQEELVAAQNATNQWLSHLAEILKAIDAKLGQQSLAGGVFYQAGAPK